MVFLRAMSSSRECKARALVKEMRGRECPTECARNLYAQISNLN